MGRLETTSRMTLLSCARMVLTCLILLIPLVGCTSPIINAARDGDTKTVLSFMDQGYDINKPGYTWVNGHQVTSTPLGAAAFFGHVDTVRALLDRGADVNAKDSWGSTPLHHAAWGGYIRVVQLLLERGSVASTTNKGGVTPADAAEKKENRTVAQLLKQAEARELGIIQVPTVPPQVASVPPSPTAPVNHTSDVDRLPSFKTTPNKHAYAVVVGIEQYREKLPKADFADRDATLVGEYLTKVLGYPEQNVIVRVNDKAARTDLEKYFEGWLPNNVEKDSSVFIYYSGHGAPNPKSGDAYLVPYDGDPTFVERTAYPLKRLYAALDKLPAKEITVVLDSCFSGAGGRSVLAEGARPMGLSIENTVLASGKTVVLAASSGDQISSTFKDKGHGLLTYFFLKGLQGEADANKDGSIDMTELYEYVKPKVQSVARKQYNNEQTPQLLASPDVLKKGGGRLVERSSK